MSEQQNVNLGHLAGPEARRDAVHVAVVPCVAGMGLSSGEPVKIDSDGRASLCSNWTKAIGVVDPFLQLTSVHEDDRFWLFLKPGTITGMRHAWVHPAFPEALEPPAIEAGVVQKAVSKAWLLGWCRRLWPYEADDPENMLAYLLQSIQEGNVCFGITDWSEGMHYNEDTSEYELPAEFWQHYKVLTGQEKPGKPVSFRCAC